MKGQIIGRHGGWYEVLDEKKEAHICKLKGVLKKENSTTNLAVVGDFVVFEKSGFGDSLITEILPRKTVLRRAKGFSLKREGKSGDFGQILIANLDQVFLVIPCKEPDFHPLLLERFLVMVEYMKIAPVILLNKIDLDSDHQMEGWIHFYEKIGYGVIGLSVVDQRGIKKLKEMMTGKLSFLMGPSGAGKSTLIHSLDPNQKIRIGQWSERCKTGPQTTTTTKIYALEDSSLIADTAGFSNVYLHHIPKEELHWCYPDFEEFLPCRYQDCLHRPDEEECSIMTAKETQKLDSGRHERYLQILSECGNHEGC